MKVPLVDLKAQYESIRLEIDEAIARTLGHTGFIRGPETSSFEAEFAEWCGSRACVGTSSGTDALYLALRVLGVGPGDEVITTPHTFIATAEAITLNGAIPRFVDTEPDSFNLSPERIGEAVNENTRGIVVVHLNGQPARMDEILEIAGEHGLFVVEDAAQAHGAEWCGKKAGTLGNAGCFSFFPGKNLGAYGDAGAVVSDDGELIDRIRCLGNHGRKDKFCHDQEGLNCRMDGLQAAVLRAKLGHLNDWIRARREKAAFYNHLLSEVDRVDTPFVEEGCLPAWHLYVVRVEKRDECRTFLKERGIMAGIHYPIPLHLQPAYARLGHREGEFPHAEANSKRILSLPLYPEISEAQQRYVVDCLKEFTAGSSALSD